MYRVLFDLLRHRFLYYMIPVYKQKREYPQSNIIYVFPKQ